MTVAGLTPRLREEGRLRMGDSEPIRGKKGRRPVKLTEWRLTSPNREAIETAARLWGGEAHEWTGAPGEQQQWEVLTEASELNVLVPFPQDLEERQLYELYTAGGRTRACNGREEFLSGGPCLCEPDQRECRLTTHLLVVLPELPGIGVWRLTTSGYNAAVELAGAMRILRSIHARSHFATAALVLEQRSQRIPGQAERQFVVPVLRLPYSLAEAGLVAAGTRPGLPAGVDLVTGEIVSGSGLGAPAAPDSSRDELHRPGTPSGGGEKGRPSHSSTEPPPDEVREGEALRETAVPADTAEVESPSRRPCLHLQGIDAEGYCRECGFPVEGKVGA